MKTYTYTSLVSLLTIFSCSPDTVNMTRVERNNNSHDPAVSNHLDKSDKEMDQSNYTIYRTIMENSVDGATENIVNQQMDKQAEELKAELEEATVHRVGDGIHITFSSDKFFGHDSETLSIDSRNVLKNISLVLNKYDNNDLMVEAHTDGLGDDDYNLRLTENRTDNIKEYLVAQGVEATRIYTRGCGESQPIAENEEQSGQALNRRIDIAIFPKADIKEAVLNGDIK